MFIFIVLLLMIKIMIYFLKYYGLFEELKGRKNVYYGKVLELICILNFEGYDLVCRYKNVYN